MAQGTDDTILIKFKENLDQTVDGNTQYGLQALVNELDALHVINPRWLRLLSCAEICSDLRHFLCQKRHIE